MNIRRMMNLAPRTLSILFAVAAACLCGAAAQANIVADSGFEAEDASGGPVTVTNPVTWVFGGDAGIDTTDPASGFNDAFLGTGAVSQTLAPLVVGATYSISFDLAADARTISNAQAYDAGTLFGALPCSSDACFNASVTVTFDGQQLAEIAADSVASGYGTPFTAVATDASGDLSFAGLQNEKPGYAGLWYLDNVVVECTANCGISAIPEPTDLSLLLTALAAYPFVAGARRRRASR
jgi:hypothetical protein